MILNDLSSIKNQKLPKLELHTLYKEQEMSNVTIYLNKYKKKILKML